MHSNCCGASEWMEGTEICSDCKEHASFDDWCEDCDGECNQGECKED